MKDSDIQASSLLVSLYDASRLKSYQWKSKSSFTLYKTKPIR